MQNRNITFARILYTMTKARAGNLHVAISRLDTAYKSWPQDAEECKRAQLALERAVIAIAETYQHAHEKHNLINEFGEEYPG
jgi:hypothetical protein